MLVAIDAIDIGSGHRRTDKRKVKELADSIATIGLKIPITVRRAPSSKGFILVAGRHRIEAHRLLGIVDIEATVLTDELEADLWELSENYHRADLTAMQRNVALGQWVKLKAKKIKRDQASKVAQVGPPAGGAQPLDAGMRAASRELGVPRATAQRAVNIATHLTKKAQKEAERVGLANNQRALERAAGVPGEQEQIASLRRTVKALEERKKTKARIQENPVRGQTAEEAFKCWFCSLEVDMQAKVRSWLLGIDLTALVNQLEQAQERQRADGMTLH